jgi:hypothetical protein
LVPPELVDAALDETRAVQRRVRGLPSRVVVYLLLAACLFPGVGYTGVWRKLTASLPGRAGAGPSASAMSQARRRIGAAPLRRLFDLLRSPLSFPRLDGVWWRGLLVCAVDGTVLTVPDAPGVLARYRKQSGGAGGKGATGYPQVRLLALAACGTRALVDAVFAPTTAGETTLFPGLARSMRPGMVVLADRNFDANDVMGAARGAGADFLVRAKDRRLLPVLARHPDGSYTSVVDGHAVRVVDAEVAVTTGAGRHAGRCRLLTSLLDPAAYPAAGLARLYHERWEIETGFLELKSSMLGGRVLRARTAEGIDQEVWALLVVYQLLRTAVADAALAGGLDPDRGSFTVALEAARDLLVRAEEAVAGAVVGVVGQIGRRVLASPLPKRRLRVCPRVVKRAISKYQARGADFDRKCRKAVLEISVQAGEPP